MQLYFIQWHYNKQDLFLSVIGTLILWVSKNKEEQNSYKITVADFPFIMIKWKNNEPKYVIYIHESTDNIDEIVLIFVFCFFHRVYWKEANNNLL